MTDCECGFDGDWSACCSGAVYGRCEDEDCGGVCEFKGYCECPCHAETGPRGTVTDREEAR